MSPNWPKYCNDEGVVPISATPIKMPKVHTRIAINGTTKNRFKEGGGGFWGVISFFNTQFPRSVKRLYYALH